MIILGIETSCDETAAAVVEDGRKILSNVVASSAALHTKTGGVIPETAARKQLEYIIPVIQKALNDANFSYQKIDTIAVTTGPGLIGSLLVGIETAKALALLWKKPIIPVNHLIGHIYANWLEGKSEPQFPALALVVSGGHTDLISMKGHGKFAWIAGTRDDAAGEAFDKTARLLKIPYPGGPNLAKKADSFISKQKSIKLDLFPRPMIAEDNFDWSFSGLKTAVFNYLAQNKGLPKDKVAAEIQEAIVDSLIVKSLKAIRQFKPKSFLLAGGVAANTRLTIKFVAHTKAMRVNFFVPPPRLCTDNAAYIAAAAAYNNKSISWRKVGGNPQLSIVDKPL